MGLDFCDTHGEEANFAWTSLGQSFAIVVAWRDFALHGYDGRVGFANEILARFLRCYLFPVIAGVLEIWHFQDVLSGS